MKKKVDLLSSRSAMGKASTPPSHASKAPFLLIQAQLKHIQSPSLAQPSHWTHTSTATGELFGAAKEAAPRH